jgi:putative transposase
MLRKRVTNEQIAFALGQSENGATVDEVCRKMGVSEPTFYRWKKQFVGMGVNGWSTSAGRLISAGAAKRR